MIEFIILKAFLDFKTFKEYSHLVDEKYLKESSDELNRLYLVIKDFHEKYPDKGISSIDELEVLFFTAYPATPAKKQEAVRAICKRIQEVSVSEDSILDYFYQLRNKNFAYQLASKALEVAQGKEKIEDLNEWIRDSSPSISTESKYSSRLHSSRVLDLVEIDGNIPEGALHWRLECLNKSIGPLQRGDFGIIFARPETGKTTLVADQCSYMLSQSKLPVAWLINEERGAKVLRRIVQSHLGWTSQEIAERSDFVKDVYETDLRDKLYLVHNPNMHYRECQALFKDIQPGLIIIDQLDKVSGFQNDRHDLQLGEAYKWARRMAHEFGPVIGVSQASESAEGKRWLQMSDIADSKTSKPAEADWILGVGKTHEEALKEVRHFHIIKNKGDSFETIEAIRHGKFDVIIHPAQGRYEDLGKYE